MLGVGPAAGPVLDVESLHPAGRRRAARAPRAGRPAAGPSGRRPPSSSTAGSTRPATRTGSSWRSPPGSGCGSRSRPPSTARRSTASSGPRGQGRRARQRRRHADPGDREDGQAGTELVAPRPVARLHRPGGTTEITLALRDLEGRGGVGFPYRIVVGRSCPTFEPAARTSQVSIPRGGTAAVGVTVVRKGYNGPITLTVADPPAGLTVRPGTIAAGQTVGVLSISAPPTPGLPRRAPEARRPRRRDRRPDRGRGVPQDRLRPAGDAADQRRVPERPARRARPAAARHARRAGRADRGRPRLRGVDPGQGRADEGSRRAPWRSRRFPCPPAWPCPRRRSPRRPPRGPSRSTPRSRPPRAR